MTLALRRKKIIDVINELFDHQEESETMADLVKEGRKEHFHITQSEEFFRGLASGYQRSAMRLMKLKREIEIEIEEEKRCR